MKNEKTREEVVAEREAKKKAKLTAKKKLNATALATSSTEEGTKPQSTAPLETTTKETQSQQVQGASSVATSKSKKNERRKGKKSESEIVAGGPKTESPKPSSTTNHPDRPPIQKPPAVPNRTEPVAQTKAEGDNKENESRVAEEPDNKTSKAELKAARRAKQEAQRAAKAQKPSTQAEHERKGPTEEAKQVIAPKRTKPRPSPSVAAHRVKLFNHLYCDDAAPATAPASPHLHPAVVSLGVRYASGVVVGSNARCFALMAALKAVVNDYSTPRRKEFSRGLESSLAPCLAHLHRCRPLAVSMTNAVRHLRWQMTQLPNEVADDEAKLKIVEAIDTYLRDQIDVAGQAISISVRDKISDGDVILTYGCSSLIQRILTEAHEGGKRFRVVVVDSRPLREGLQLLRRLVASGVRCSYVLVGAASCMMREATKVLLGAHALLANGYVTSRAGSAQVALLARSHNVPVLVCCETHKFCERVQTDALVHNEIGDPDALATRQLGDWRSIADLTPLNLAYDVTPPDLVTAVVTELAILPCTSVPVILRIKTLTTE